MRVLITADNQDITCEGIKAVARRMGLFDEIWQSQTQRELALRLAKAPSAVAVIDYTLLDTTAEHLLILPIRFPQARFILFSDTLSPDFIRRMVFSSPAFSIVLKDSPLEEIEEAFAQVSAHRQYCCSKVSGLLQATEERPEENASPLTVTEKEVLRAMSLGKTTKQIAAERFLSVYTVMTHRKNIFRKLGVNNAQEAVRYALRAGIISAGDYYI